MDVSLSGSDTPFNVSGQLLVASDCDYSFDCGYFHAQVELMDDCLKFVDEAPTEDCIIWIVHFHDIEGNRFGPWVREILEGYWEGYLSEGIYSFAPEADEWDIRRLQKVAVDVHAVEGT